MAAFAIAMSTSVRFLLRPTATSAFLHAVATGVAIDVRVVGIVLPAATAAFFLLRLARAEVPRPTVSTLALYLGLTAGTVVALWPYLCAAPWSNFVVRRGHDGDSGPARATAMAALAERDGAAGSPVPFPGRGSRGERDRAELGAVRRMAAAVLHLPCLRSGVPAGLGALLGWRPGKLRSGWLGVVALGTALSLAHVGHWMARAHPYQNLYFNALAGPDPKMRFDADYWGLTNRERSSSS